MLPEQESTCCIKARQSATLQLGLVVQQKCGNLNHKHVFYLQILTRKSLFKWTSSTRRPGGERRGRHPAATKEDVSEGGSAIRTYVLCPDNTIWLRCCQAFSWVISTRLKMLHAAQGGCMLLRAIQGNGRLEVPSNAHHVTASVCTPEAADALKCGPYEGAKARKAASNRNT